MFFIFLTLVLAAFADGRNASISCPKIAVQAFDGGSLLWQLLVQGYYILNNISGQAYELVSCRDKSLVDQPECFISALDNLKNLCQTYHPYIVNYKKQVYNYGVNFAEDWECCVGSESCQENKMPLDKIKLHNVVNVIKTASTPPVLPTVPDDPPSKAPNTSNQLGSISIRGRLFGIDILLIDIDLTNLFV